MDALAQLEHDHGQLHERLTRFETLLGQPGAAARRELEGLLNELVIELPAHIGFEEERFYEPLKASGRLWPEHRLRLLDDHRDLLYTVSQLREFRDHGWSSTSEVFLAYSAHLIELFREHEDREHRWLIPLCDRLPVIV